MDNGSPVDLETPTKRVVKGLNQLSSYFSGYKLTPKCKFIYINLHHGGPLMVAQWLRYCATNWKVAGSILDGDIDMILPIAL
jgi:hypothetical protein